MTIEIHKPELEALISERLKTGAFRTVEDVLMQALQATSLPLETGSVPAGKLPRRTGSELVAAMQASPYKEINLEPVRGRLPVREASF